MDTRQHIIIGSRCSALAVVQSEHVASLLRAAHPSLTVSIETSLSTGDKVLDRPLNEIASATGLFTTELEQGLLRKQTHIAVHSLKDMPTSLPPDLMLGAVTERESPGDCLLVKKCHAGCGSLAGLPPNAVVGTSSLRRQAYIARHHPHLQVKCIRGNLNTRLVSICTVVIPYFLLNFAFDSHQNTNRVN